MAEIIEVVFRDGWSIDNCLNVKVSWDIVHNYYPIGYGSVCGAFRGLFLLVILFHRVSRDVTMSGVVFKNFTYVHFSIESVKSLLFGVFSNTLLIRAGIQEFSAGFWVEGVFNLTNLRCQNGSGFSTVGIFASSWLLFLLMLWFKGMSLIF